MPAATFKGSIGGGTPADLTATQATALLNAIVGDSGAGGTKGLAPAPAAGDAAAGKFLKADGTYQVPAGGSGGSSYNPANVSITGGTITGTLVTGLSTPVNASDAANKQYVDNIAIGTIYHTQASYTTAAVLPNTPAYANGTAGVGAALTSATNTALVVDGATVSALGTRVLVKNQAAPAQNGIYTLTQAGTGSVPWILTRAVDFDMAAAGEIDTNAYFFVGLGTVNAATAWVMNTPAPITVGTTGLAFTQTSGNTAYTAGTGLSLVGNAFSLTTPVTGANGGTGVANSGKTITLGGNLVTSGAFNTTFTVTADTGVTLPTTGTLLSTAAIITCNGANFLQSGAGAFSCATAPTQSPIALGPGLTITRGTDNAGPLVPGTNTLFKQDFPKNITANTTIALTHIDYTLNANGAGVLTFTLPAATASTGVVGSTGNGFCIRDKAGLGFTISSGTAMYGMAGVSSTSFTFSPNSFVCPSSDGATWALSGLHGVLPTAQLPVLANGHILGNMSGSSGFARDVTVVAGTGISLDASGNNLTITNTGGGGGGADSVGVALTALGTGQSNCLALTAQQNQITGGAANTAVCLPVPTGGAHTSVYNDTATDKLVCPSTGKKINNFTVTTECAVLAARNNARFESPTTAGWYSIP